MNIVDKITKIFNDLFPSKTIIFIIDYYEHDKYVIHAIPTTSIARRKEFQDGMYSLNRETLEFEGGFMPLAEDPGIFFNLPEDRMLYKLEG